jgi:energy-coupling factor transporter ATP-binding protein EcfA2
MIEISDLHFGYEDGPQVFDGLAVEIETGRTVAVCGANGTGKSTLLRLLAGLLEPDAGTITIEGEAPTVGLAPETPADGLFAASVREEVAFFPTNRGLDVEERVADALSALGIEHLADRSPQTLSEGQKRLVTVAAVLSGAPDVVGLDEPTSGLDADAWRRLGERLAGLSETVLFVTHDTDFAWRYADRVLVLSPAGLERYGPTEAVLADAATDLSDYGLREPEAVAWAREHDVDPPPRSVDAAVETLEGNK